MMEQSVKIALGAFVFKPNVQNTWLDVQSSITNFLTAQWNNGVLAGATPGDAFSVAVGLGVTMTPQDILDGYMRVEIKLAVVRPAEFIVVTFQQQMQKS
jgi:phage tail sheath protein FI